LKRVAPGTKYTSLFRQAAARENNKAKNKQEEEEQDEL